jgi:NADPH-dependent 2,4-dienoyl-CoA reductase/sulfur reductase-like enzyme
VCLGAVRDTEWLQGCGLAVGSFGIACDAGCRALAINAVVTEDVFVAGDVARFPHPLYDYQFMALEHWGNAVAQAQIAAHNMSCLPSAARMWPCRRSGPTSSASISSRLACPRAPTRS